MLSFASKLLFLSFDIGRVTCLILRGLGVLGRPSGLNLISGHWSQRRNKGQALILCPPYLDRATCIASTHTFYKGVRAVTTLQ